MRPRRPLHLNEAAFDITKPSRLDEFRTIYNTARLHRAHPQRLTPNGPNLARPKANPTGQLLDTFRIRRDTVDQFGKLTLRHGSRLHHRGVSRAHAHTPVLILVTTDTVTVISKTGHQLVARHHIDADRNYWPNHQKNPGRWPGKSVTHDATHV